jgi:hypothetical protein
MTCIKHNRVRDRRRRDLLGFTNCKRRRRSDWRKERARAYAYAMAGLPAAALATDSHYMAIYCLGPQRERLAASVLRALRRDARLLDGAKAVRWYWCRCVVLLRPRADGWSWHAHTIDEVIGGSKAATFDDAKDDAERFLAAYYSRAR